MSTHKVCSVTIKFIIITNTFSDYSPLLELHVSTPQPLYNTIVGVHSINRVS